MHYTKPKLIQLIHIAKNKLNMDDDSYRAMLQRITQKSTAREMSITELMKVYAEMEKKGFKKITKNKNHSPTTQKATAKSKIATKIRAIWINMAKQGLLRDGSENAMNAWVRGVVNPILARHNKPLALNVGALDDQMASLVVERLKKWQARGEK